jgi:hypothetical protein
LKLGPALTLSQNPIFEMASNNQAFGVFGDCAETPGILRGKRRRGAFFLSRDLNAFALGNFAYSVDTRSYDLLCINSARNGRRKECADSAQQSCSVLQIIEPKLRKPDSTAFFFTNKTGGKVQWPTQIKFWKKV